MRTKTDVLGISTLGMLLSIMVTKSVLNMHTQTTVLGVGNMALLYARGKAGSGSLNYKPWKEKERSAAAPKEKQRKRDTHTYTHTHTHTHTDILQQVLMGEF